MRAFILKIFFKSLSDRLLNDIRRMSFYADKKRLSGKFIRPF